MSITNTSVANCASGASSVSSVAVPGQSQISSGTTVLRDVPVVEDPANRVTWWCPHCQPGPGPEARLPVRVAGGWRD